MEPLDSGKNVESSRCSKRRISSILKAPRKSSVLRDSEQQENEVEITKPVEKRNSRRVSFAPANDVLLFAKDAKNVSPSRSPLQELLGAATATTQNRVQVVATEDTSPQIVGIETLLNAPLHASQQRIMVNFDNENDFGEKTVMFSTEDAGMDITHSHTININSDAFLLGDLSHQSYDCLLSAGEGNVIDVSTDVPNRHSGQPTNQPPSLSIEQKADSSTENEARSTTMPLLDPVFKNFLSSLSNPRSSSTNAVLTGITSLTGPSCDETKPSSGQREPQSLDVGKENQVPKSLSSSRNIREDFGRSAFPPEDEAQIGCFLGAADDDDDPFKCLFPTQEMYEKSEGNASQAKQIKKQQSCKSSESTNLKKPQESYKVCSVSKNDSREKAVVFPADESMDITQSHTGKIISSSSAHALISPNSLGSRFTELPESLSKPIGTRGNLENPRMQSITAPSLKQTVSSDRPSSHSKMPVIGSDKNCPLNTSKGCRLPLAVVGPEDMSIVQTDVDMKEVQTGRIIGVQGSDDPFQSLIPSQENLPLCKNQKKEVFSLGVQDIEGPKLSDHTGMKTLSKLSMKMEPLKHQDKFLPSDDCKERALRLPAEHTCLDSAQSQTLFTTTDIKLESHQNIKESTTCGKETMCAGNDAAMDMTQCLTVDIASKLASGLFTSDMSQADPSKHKDSFSHGLDPAPHNLLTAEDCDADPVPRVAAAPSESFDGGFTIYQDDMDITENLTGQVEIHHLSVDRKSEGMAHLQLDETFGTSNYAGTDASMKTSLKKTMESNQVVFDSKDDCRENTVRFTAADGLMDITECNTVSISWDLPLDSQLNVHLPANVERNVRFNANDAKMDETKSHTVNIIRDATLQSSSNVILAANGEKTVRFNVNDAEMDVTKSHTVSIMRDLPLQSSLNVVLAANGEKTLRFNANEAEMDVTKSHTVNIMRDLPLQSSSNVVLAANGEKTLRFNVNEAEMDVTKSHTVNIIRDSTLQSFPNVILAANEEKTVRFNVNDAEMDVTKSHTVNIMRDLPLQPSLNVALAANGEKTLRFNANEAEMDVTKSHTVNIMRDLPPQSSTNVLFGVNGDKTVRFDANDAEMDAAHDFKVLEHRREDLPADGPKTLRLYANETSMDVTRSHTAKMSTDLKMLPKQNEDPLTASGEKTVRFTVNDATMDVTKSHTVNIAHDFNLLAHQKVDILPAERERTVMFGVNGAEMEVTKSLTVNILTNSNVVSEQVVNPPPTTEGNRAGISTNNATMGVPQNPILGLVTDVDQKPDQILGSLTASTGRINDTLVGETGSHTESIAKNYKPNIVESLPKSGDRSPKFTTDHPTMDMTHCLGLNTVNNQQLKPVLSDKNPPFMHENMNDALAIKEMDSGTCGMDSCSDSSSSPQPKPAAKNNSLFHMSFPERDASLCPDSCLKTKELDTDAENESLSLVSDDLGKLMPGSKTDMEEINSSMGMAMDQTKSLVSFTDNPTQGTSLKQNPQMETFKESDLASRSVAIPGSSGSDELENMKEYQPKAETHASSKKMENSPSTSDQNADVLPTQTSRRKSLADLQSKLKRLSHVINEASDAAAVESSTGPLPHLDSDLNKNANPTQSVAEPVLEMGLGNSCNDTGAQNPTKAEFPSVATSTTPFSLKTKQLMSRLSVGGFKPKLPKRNNPDELKKSAVEGKPTKTSTVSATNQLSGFDNVPDIFDEELIDCEDLSEIMDTMTPEKIPKMESPSSLVNMSQSFEDEVFNDFMSSGQRRKRSLPENEESKEDEKRQKICTEFAETAFQPDVDCDSNVTLARTQTVDSSSSSHTASRCESASESAFKHSLFESQLEDYSSDGQKKLEDGSITVLEFFKLFSIDFVIHNSRQSVLPGRLLSNTDATPLDLLKDKYISRPKQMVYEADVQSLTEKVEGLKYRMQDLNRSLKTINASLWEEVKHFTEKQLKSFGAKLKERNNFFRKKSKCQSHEMKEVLYANLVLANLEEQQKLKGTINQADEMIHSLDICISELEAELDAVEEKGSEDKPGLKSLQEEMSKVTESLADHERQIAELDLEKKKNSSDLKRLKAETTNLQTHVEALNMVNEWRLEEKDDSEDDCSVYSFLHRTLFLQLVYEKTSGNDADSRSEKKTTNISFNFHLNDEKSQSHARLVHKLVSQYIDGQSGWVEKYPTSRHVPKLLHDVSLVVGRCRLLGEELRLLKIWGSLRFDILNINCSETQVHVIFSSLKTFSKFEVVFSASLTNQHCIFYVQSFRNLIGSTTIQQVEEIVASLSPGKNLLTKIVKKLHETLLS